VLGGVTELTDGARVVVIALATHPGRGDAGGRRCLTSTVTGITATGVRRTGPVVAAIAIGAGLIAHTREHTEFAIGRVATNVVGGAARVAGARFTGSAGHDTLPTRHVADLTGLASAPRTDGAVIV